MTIEEVLVIVPFLLIFTLVSFIFHLALFMRFDKHLIKHREFEQEKERAEREVELTHNLRKMVFADLCDYFKNGEKNNEKQNENQT